jgi:SAM-dependent methyltransferase
VVDRFRTTTKGQSELRYWQDRASVEGTLGNDHYEPVYTHQFSLDRAFFAGKRILDIGCGPRGSLEWIPEAAGRIGLDPLADQYREFGIHRHSMNYVGSAAESIPFRDGYLDIVTSINSLDHVDDVTAAITEIARVTRDRGDLLLSVEIGHDPTPTEPIALWFDLLDDLLAWFDVIDRRQYEMPDGHFVNDAYRDGAPFEMSRGKHPGVLVARLRRRPRAESHRSGASC